MTASTVMCWWYWYCFRDCCCCWGQQFHGAAARRIGLHQEWRSHGSLGAAKIKIPRWFPRFATGGMIIRVREASNPIHLLHCILFLPDSNTMSSRKRSKMSADDNDVKPHHGIRSNHSHVAPVDDGGDDATVKRSRTLSPSKTPAVDSSAAAWGFPGSAPAAASSSNGMAPAATTSTTGNSNGGFQFGTDNTSSTNWQPNSNSNPFPNAAAMPQPSRQFNFLADDSSNKKPPIKGTPRKQHHSNRPPLVLPSHRQSQTEGLRPARPSTRL